MHVKGERITKKHDLLVPMALNLLFPSETNKGPIIFHVQFSDISCYTKQGDMTRRVKEKVVRNEFYIIREAVIIHVIMRSQHTE